MASSRNPTHTQLTGNGSLRWLVAGLTLAAAAGGTAWLAQVRRRRLEDRPVDDAPDRAHKLRQLKRYAVVGRTVTIDAPRSEIYRFWRNFLNLPQFMENVQSVELLSNDRSRWCLAAPAGQTVELISEIVDDRENEHISWRSVEGSDIETHGSVAFREAPDGRGTEVEATIAYKPPAGDIGRLIAKMFQREPAIQSRRELKRLKMLMETGEIATAASHAA